MSHESGYPPSPDPEHCPDRGVSTPPPTDPATVCRGACEVGPIGQDERQDDARRLRLEATYCPHTDPRCVTNSTETVCAHPCNGDETFYFQSPVLPDGATPNPFQGQYPASFTKGLRHDPLSGLGDPEVYCRLLNALATADPQDFENVRPLGCESRPHPSPLPPPPPPGPLPDVPPTQRRLENPQAGIAFELEGADPAALFMPPAPCFASPREAAEAAELYWMALTRDVPFIRYDTDPLIAAAVTDLNTLLGTQTGLSPHLPSVPFSPQNVFRGPTPGDLAGPYLSQFLLMDVPYGAQAIPAVIRTLLPQVDFLTNWDDWLEVQDGCDANQTNCDPVMRLIRAGRDTAQFVHVDRDFNAFLNACELLLFAREPTRRCEARPGLGVPFGPCLPYVNPLAPGNEEFPRSTDPTQGKSQNQIGQGTFGEQHIKSVVVGAMFRAFHAVWYQKWFVHRRLRPEEFGGRIHLENLRRRGIPGGSAFPIDQLLFDSTTLFGDPNDPNDPGLVFDYNARQNANRRTPPTDRLGRPSFDGTYLLPQVFAEGSPLHPSYGSGHSTVSGCLATILKAFFHNDWRFPSPVEPNEDGTSVRPFTGSDALTVAGELDKLASNVGLGRDWAGVHWRSDHEEALLQGEQVAISILCNQRNLFNEPFEFRFRSFSFGPYQGKVVRIRPAISQWCDPDDSCEPCVCDVDLLDDYDPILVPTAPGCGRRRRPGAST